jgi:hypothetical protein
MLVLPEILEQDHGQKVRPGKTARRHMEGRRRRPGDCSRELASVVFVGRSQRFGVFVSPVAGLMLSSLFLESTHSPPIQWRGFRAGDQCVQVRLSQ